MEVTYQGMRVLFLENATLRVGVLIDKGTDIFSFLYKPLDVDFLWRTPWGMRNPLTFVPTSASPNGSFMDYFEGGWQELFPAGGPAYSWRGASIGQHGEVALMPWTMQIVADRPDIVSVAFSVRTVRTPFQLDKTFTLRGDDPVLYIEERATNVGGLPMELTWGHHPAFGEPFLDDSCIIDTGARRVRSDPAYPNTMRSQAGEFAWPVVPGREGGQVDLSRIPAPDQGCAEMVFLTDFVDETAWYAITNTRRKVGFGISWPRELFPWMWYWQMARGDDQSPFFNNVYAVALEPFSTGHYPLPNAVKANDALTILPGQFLDISLRAVAYAGVERVAGISMDGAVKPA